MIGSADFVPTIDRTRVLILSAITVCSFSQALFAAEDEERFWDISRIGVEYANISYRVHNMPAEIRDVPIHPDDDYVPSGNAGPIEETRYTASSMWTLDLSGRKYIRERLRWGLGLKWIVYPTRMLYDNELRNYTTDVGTETGGSGAALTFVGLEARGVIPATDVSFLDALLNIMPEVMVEYALDRDRNLFLGASAAYFNMQAVNGWDRYSDLEVKDRFTLTHVVPLSLYLNWKDTLIVGGRYNLAFNTDKGDEADADMEDFSVFVSLGLSF